MAFTDIITGHNTLAADINQIVDALNGTVGSLVLLLATASNAVGFQDLLPSAPTSDQSVAQIGVNGDTLLRIGFFVGGSSRVGYGGLVGGNGTTITSHFYAVSSGWFADEVITAGSDLVAFGKVSVYGGSGSEQLRLTWTNSQFSYIATQQSGSAGIRFQTAGLTIAHFGKSSDTYQLIVNGGFQYGSGGADDAELIWADVEEPLPPASVVCWEDEDRSPAPGYGGSLVVCTHDDCPGAGIVSTRPASAKGGRLLDAWDTDDETGERIYAPVYDTDARWTPLALEGRVPVRVVGDPASYRPREHLVSAGSSNPGQARRWAPGDAWPIGVVVSSRSDVDGRPLPAGTVLALVR